MEASRVSGSFRDPSGFVFSHSGVVYRQVNTCYREDYDLLMGSGLYQSLADDGLLVRHEETSEVQSQYPDQAYRVLRPDQLPFISYPYEWCFSAFKDAALLTLEIQKRALKHGMTLKDCSAYNIQFVAGRPVFIDTLSFEKYVEGLPWTPYRQFCQHFLAPIALMSGTDIRLRRLLRPFIDGIPLDLAAKLLPYKTRFSFPLLLHIHLHAKTQRQYADTAVSKKSFERKISRTSLLGLLDSLESAIRSRTWRAAGTEWADYYSDDSYTQAGLEHKKQLVEQYLDEANPKDLWDLGGNTGLHSRIASSRGIGTVSFDVDPACVEMNYLQMRKDKDESILPLVLDLTNPSPALGWNNDERMSLAQRGPVDAVMALALIHHLAISNNVPLGMLAEFFAGLGRWLIIEFVPKGDHKVQKLLATREDIFPDYTSEGFERAFQGLFAIRRKETIRESTRELYLLERK